MQAPQCGGTLFAPVGKKRIHALDEGNELRMLVNGGLDGRLGHGQIKIAGEVGFEQRLPELRANGPVTCQRIHIRRGDSAAQVALDVLNVLALLAVYVARDVEVELVPLDLLERDHTRVFCKLQALIEDIHDLVDVPGAQAVLVAVFHVARAGVNHENAFPAVGVFLINDNDASGDAGAVKEVCG